MSKYVPIQICALVQNFGNEYLEYERTSWMVTRWSWIGNYIDSRFFLFGWL